MKKIFVSLFAAAAVLAACSEQPEAVTPATVSIEPVITRALSLNFKTGNKIGLDIIKSDETLHAENACLTYDGTTFNGNLMWYAEGGENCSLVAYYPYQEDGLPASFTVAADQSAGTDASDFMIATKTGVRPSYSPVVMQFKHIFSQVSIKVDNKADVPLENVTVRGLIPTATITKAEDGTYTVAADASAEAAAILAEKLVDNKEYCAVVVPQAFTSMDVVLGIKDASAVVTNIDAAELKAGYSYTINLVISTDGVSATLGGEIENWKDGGELGGEVQAPAEFEEFDGYFIYHGVRYNTVTLKDGKTWMAQNLAYVPEGLTPCNDLNNVAAGVYCPVIFNTTNSSLEFSDDPAVISSNGYLYQTETALGLAVNSLTTSEAAAALEGAQGICPDGWHIPTISDITGLVGKATTPISTNTEAPYYNGANGSISLLNADGFNLETCGAVSIGDNTKEVATLVGKLSTYTKVSSGYFVGSTYKDGSISYITAGDAESGVKNIQFWGLMPMSNKATEAEYTCNGSALSYKIAASVRCVKNN